jgi:plastocyanin
MMRVAVCSLAVLVLAAGLVLTVGFDGAAKAQGNDPNVVMLDNCSHTDPAYGAFGGCPEGSPLRGYRGDVTVAEFFELLTSPLTAMGQIIGHPSWRNEPSYITVRAGQQVRVSNRGGRVHTFTEVQDFGGGFVPPLNGSMVPAPECGANGVPNPNVAFVGVGDTQRLEGMDAGLHKFQCCIHPWMRAAIRAE